jgi:hypothetical protein
MRRFSFAVLLSVVMVLVVLASPIATLAQKTAPVFVTNTTAAPVPVSGNVNAAVTDSVNANVTNTVPVSGAVSITGTPTVNPSNSSSTPLFLRDVDNPANEPFEWTFGTNVAPVFPASFVVPSTTADGRTVKRLVIEEVDASCSSISQPPVGFVMFPGPFCFSSAGTCQGDGPIHFYPFPVSPEPGSAMTSQLVRVYADPGVTINFNVATLEAQGICSYTASGHYIVE